MFYLTGSIILVLFHVIYQQIPLWPQKLYHLHIFITLQRHPSPEIFHLRSSTNKLLPRFHLFHLFSSVYFTFPCSVLLYHKNSSLVFYPQTMKKPIFTQAKWKDGPGNISFVISLYLRIIFRTAVQIIIVWKFEQRSIAIFYGRRLPRPFLNI